MLDLYSQYIIPAAFSILPPKMGNVDAKRMLLAIGLQESGFQHRQQIRGPAHGFLQFEQGGGIRGVAADERTRPYLMSALAELQYPQNMTEAELYRAVEHNDVLMAVFGRLFLWLHPEALPTEQDEAWFYYLDQWGPSKPHQQNWPMNWQVATRTVMRSEIAV